MDWRELYITRLCSQRDLFYILSLVSMAFLVFLGFSFTFGELSPGSELVAMIDIALAGGLTLLSLVIIRLCRRRAVE